jgi:hypothetical protein
MPVKLTHDDTPAVSDAADTRHIFGLDAASEERIITVVAIGVAVMIVATVAILMGMV